MGIYLTAIKRLGYFRVTGISFVGKSTLKTVLGAAAFAPVEAVFITGSGTLIIEGVDGAGKVIKHLIPIDVDQ